MIRIDSNSLCSHRLYIVNLNKVYSVHNGIFDIQIKDTVTKISVNRRLKSSGVSFHSHFGTYFAYKRGPMFNLKPT